MACSPTRTVDDSEIVAFNKELKDKFNDVKTVKTYMTRPTMYWDIGVSDDTHLDEIFQYIVTFIKTSNIYEKKIKDAYTGLVWADSISITFIKDAVLRRYEGSYLKKGPNALNEIDNFNTWSISEERGQPGARYDMAYIHIKRAEEAYLTVLIPARFAWAC
jgi:hypothetical protein